MPKYHLLPYHFQIALDILSEPQTVTYLASRIRGSERLVKSNIAKLREMGCVIDSIRIDGAYHYKLMNKDQVFDKLLLWIELEQKQTLLAD